MKTTKVVGMNRPVCANCFDYPENCTGCVFHTCSVCKEELTDGEAYEYRGAYSCQKHHLEVIEKRDFERQEVMIETEHSVRSQSGGEWQNGGYRTMKTDTSGNPITKIKEPMRLAEYEGR